MIRLLQGQIHSKEDRALILLVNGVGYHVLVPSVVLAESEEEVTLHIHTHIREDQFTLYGFNTKKDLKFFELVLTINGVGPKMALAILNEPEAHIQNAIFNGDIKALTKISGIGKKIAERIILELKSKVEPSEGVGPAPITDVELDADVILTLENLGYKRSHIKRVLSTVDKDLESEEEVIRYFLQNV